MHDCLLVFGNPDETLALVFESSHCAQLLTYGAVGILFFLKKPQLCEKLHAD